MGILELRRRTIEIAVRSAGAIRVTEDGRLEALQRMYVPQKMDEQLIRLWGTVLADVATTYVRNLTRDTKTPIP